MTPELQKICEPFGISAIPTNAHRHALETYALKTLENILATHGPEHLTLVLRSIVETNGNARELVAPTIWAIGDVIRAHPSWPTSRAWLDALDRVDLNGLLELARENRAAVKLRHGLATMAYLHLRQVLEPAI